MTIATAKGRDPSSREENIPGVKVEERRQMERIRRPLEVHRRRVRPQPPWRYSPLLKKPQVQEWVVPKKETSPLLCS